MVQFDILNNNEEIYTFLFGCQFLNGHDILNGIKDVEFLHVKP